ncbi:MAG: helix-turn-helix domain-containing protein [Alphaproteobacteria bacterium]
MITPAQCRAARGLLDWNQDALATASEVGVVAVRQFEKGVTVPRRATLSAICRALESAGVRFTPNGVELTRNEEKAE